METTMASRKSNQAALAAFISKKAELDAMLARLSAFSDAHFGLAPEEINWGDVGSLSDWTQKIREVSVRVFREGEYAP